MNPVDRFQRDAKAASHSLRPRDATDPDEAVVVDACILGAGLTGLSVAYELALRGRHVAVVDDHTSVGATTPEEVVLSAAFDGCLTRLEARHGLEGARLAVESQAWAIDRIRHIATTERFDCGFDRVPRDFDETSCNGAGTLHHELGAALRAGLSHAVILRVDGTTREILRVPDQARIHASHYAKHMTRGLRFMGAEVISKTHVDRIDGQLIPDAEGVEKPWTIAYAGDREIVRAPVVIITTHGFVQLPDESAHDVLGRMGRVEGKPGVYVVRHGPTSAFTDGVIGGALVAELMAGRNHRWSKVYDPMRRMPPAVPRFQPGAPAAVTPFGAANEVASPADIARGQGGVIRMGTTHLAVFRDEGGALHQHSAECPHLGGIVTWNSVDQTFDCPCHGSRFTANGKRICGPADEDLADLPPAGLDAAPDSHTRVAPHGEGEGEGAEAPPWDRAAQHIR